MIIFYLLIVVPSLIDKIKNKSEPTRTTENKRT